MKGMFPSNYSIYLFVSFYCFNFNNISLYHFSIFISFHSQTSQGEAASFTQSVPIPAYLLAIVVGDLESRVIGPRSKVWSEPQLINASAFEFTDTESFIATAEKIVGPYVWGIYGEDLLTKECCHVDDNNNNTH